MHYGTNWSNTQQESKYLGDEYVDKERLLHDFTNIHAKITVLGLQYIFISMWVQFEFD